MKNVRGRVRTTYIEKGVQLKAKISLEGLTAHSGLWLIHENITRTGLSTD